MRARRERCVQTRVYLWAFETDGAAVVVADGDVDGRWSDHRCFAGEDGEAVL